MAAAEPSKQVDVPFPIFKLANRYLLYDVDTVSYARREHNISGVLIGGLPQASQQNVFLGLPLQLMPEEVLLLVERKVAYVVDDVSSHQRRFLGNGLGADERRAYQAALRKQGTDAANDAKERADERKKTALKSKAGTENWNDIPDDMFLSTGGRSKNDRKRDRSRARAPAEQQDDEVLFASPMNSFPTHPDATPDSSTATGHTPEPWAVTPTTSYSPLKFSTEDGLPPPDPTPSYPLFKHLHQEGYFLSPGLRFGCQYMAYPGDPLRFHSHFLCRGLEWDGEFDLLDLVGGGRLGTGVKKSYLIGGQVKVGSRENGVNGETTSPLQNDMTSAPVRAFCVEWGGM